MNMVKDYIKLTKENIEKYCKLIKFTYIDYSRVDGSFICVASNDFNLDYFNKNRKYLDLNQGKNYLNHLPTISTEQLNIVSQSKTGYLIWVTGINKNYFLNETRLEKLEKILADKQ